MVLAGPAMWSQQSFLRPPSKGRTNYRAPSTCWGGQAVGCWMERQRSGCGRGWDRSQHHIPGSSGCHHSWSEHEPGAQSASVSPELNAPIAPGAPEMRFSEQVPHSKEQLSRGSLGPAWAESQPAPAAPDRQETQVLLLLIHLGKREDAFAVPYRKGAPAPKDWHPTGICPPSWPRKQQTLMTFSRTP